MTTIIFSLIYCQNVDPLPPGVSVMSFNPKFPAPGFVVVRDDPGTQWPFKKVYAFQRLQDEISAQLTASAQA